MRKLLVKLNSALHVVAAMTLTADVLIQVFCLPIPPPQRLPISVVVGLLLAYPAKLAFDRFNRTHSAEYWSRRLAESEAVQPTWLGQLLLRIPDEPERPEEMPVNDERTRL